MLNKIFKYFHERQTQSIIYAAILIIVFSATIVFFVWSLIFLVKLIDSIVISSDEELTTTSVFDFTELEALSQKLKIVLPDAATTPAPTVEPVSEILPQATSSPEANQPLAEIPVEISVKEISLQILNGTYTGGLAKSWQEKFIDAGFSASDGKTIVTGNAKTRDYKGMEVSYKPSKAGALGKVTEVLINNGINDASIVKKEGTDELSYDFIIIIGQ